MAPTTTPIDIIVRFSTANPDVILTIDKPTSTTALSLKQQIRSRLEAPTSESRLRLIHAGKVVPDTAALAQSLNVTIPPPGRDDGSRSAKAKGKQPVLEEKPAAAAAAAAARVYVHCSIGDALSASDLAAEAQQAQEADTALLSVTHPILARTPGADAQAGDASSPSTNTTTPAPTGFDRLLTAGFTAAEVAALRTQFLAIQAHTHTPDTMPTGPTLLALEERWLESGPNAGGAGGVGDAGGFGSDDAGGLEDMLYGNLIGFFWPMGAMFWLMREEGVWSHRRQIAVLFGFLVNLAFGALRVLS